MARLIKIDKNGSKHYEGLVTCDRCGGLGGSEAWKYTEWTCWKCGGTGKIHGKWVEHTPEYQAKLDAIAEAKRAEWKQLEAERERIRKKEEEEEARKEKERREAELAKKRISQYVGEVGKRIETRVTYEYCAEYETKFGWVSIYGFKDENGNKLIWRTTSFPEAKNKDGEVITIHKGDTVTIRGTVKEHSEYRDEKQTSLTRCKFAVEA